MQQTLTLVRGLPGSGKTTIARTIAAGLRDHRLERAAVFSADDHFMVNGIYQFDPSQLPQAHRDCRRRTEEFLRHGGNAIVANTFTQAWEMTPYVFLTGVYRTRLVVVDCFDGGMSDRELAKKNVHGVPLPAIQAMRQRWEHDWRSGDVRPPPPGRESKAPKSNKASHFGVGLLFT